MSYLPQDSATPLIIVGRQRAGTRYITNILNRFKAVTIQGEVEDPILDSAARMVEDVERYYKKKIRIKAKDARWIERYEEWKVKRVSLMFSVWANCAHGRRKKATPDCRYYGYKKPGHETYYEFYEEVFPKKPIYIYCIRNFVENYLSIASRWPHKKIPLVAKDYMKSIEIYKRMKRKAPDRVLVFNLDDLIIGGFGYFEESILAPLELNPGLELKGRLARIGAKNKTVDIPGVERRKELTRLESWYVRRHPGLQREFEKFCRYASAS